MLTVLTQYSLAANASRACRRRYHVIAQQRAGHVALAFGSPFPATPGRYLDLDLVATALAAGVSHTLGRQAATAIVLGFCGRYS
jgi:hypothetical protein